MTSLSRPIIAIIIIINITTINIIINITILVIKIIILPKEYATINSSYDYMLSLC